MSRSLPRLFVGGIVLLVALATPDYCPTSPPNNRPLEPASTDRPFEYALTVNPYELSEAELGLALDRAQGAGAGAIMTGVSWWYVAPEPSPESQRWAPLDRLLEEARRRGLKVNLQVIGTPDWVHPGLEDTVPAHGLRIWHPPRGREELERFAEFVRDLVERYGSQVEHYEIWNEPNHDEFWQPSPDPAEYAALLRTAYLTAKEANPEVTVLFGGLSRNDVGYLEAYYSEAEKYPEAASEGYFFDVLDVHPYSSIPSKTGGPEEPTSPDRDTSCAVFDGDYGEVDQNFLGFEKMKSAMDEQGDTGKSIYLGEYGFPTADTWVKAVPDYRRSFFLKRAYALAHALPYVEGMRWYSYVPTGSVGEEWTIMDENLYPSMTYRALAQTTGAEDTKVAVNLPQEQGPVSGTYVVEPDPGGGDDEPDASGWELFVDGKLVGAYGGAPFEWDTHQVEDGEHSLVVAMYTKDGSVWPSNPLSLEVRNSPEGLISILLRKVIRGITPF